MKHLLFPHQKSDMRFPVSFNSISLSFRFGNTHTMPKNVNESSTSMCNAPDIHSIYHYTPLRPSVPPSSPPSPHDDPIDGTGDTAIDAAIACAASNLSFKLSAKPQSNLEHLNDPKTFSGNSPSSSP